MPDLHLVIMPGKKESLPESVRHIQVCEEVYVLEQGTEGGLPIVYFVKGGVAYALTGRQVNGVAAVVKGINTRIHGTPEP